MGICNSCESTSVATAKLILQDGRLQEFQYPVKVSYVLQTDPTCFICNSDEMDFGDVVAAISADEELQPGQLYFALPLSKLKRPLQAEDMAALAVKASSALTKSGVGCGEKCKCGRKTVAPIVPAAFPGDKEGKSPRRRERRSGGSGGRRSFTAMLSAIPE
ncbi:uncharacterized protein LOC131158904 [Malania oleifera]|uniref:uncharacterized protein LOC131158904 n=1 Tax=Malania oleifera TaxID=397392 RepID=UPI0025ADB87C|nr:uncharacterized protein LOC131158904 [Malania oleifera]